MEQANKTFRVTAENGVPFVVRRVDAGDKYGLENCLTYPHKTDSPAPLIEFYDARYPHTEFGQFVSRYNQSTLMAKERGTGINLHGGVPQWQMDGKSLDAALAAVASIGDGNRTTIVVHGREFNALYFDGEEKTNKFLSGFGGEAFGVIHSDATGAFVACLTDKGNELKAAQIAKSKAIQKTQRHGAGAIIPTNARK